MNKILLVDDSLTVRMDLSDALGAGGFEVVAAPTLADARKKLAEQTPALVVLDVHLPDGDGLTFLREIRDDARSASIPVLLLSTEAEVKDRVLGLRTGADDYVGKPYDRGYVVARARELLQGRNGTSEKTSVLLIDDSTTFRESVRDALVGLGFDVITASSGEEGLRLAAGRRPSAIVCDGMMGGIDGATVIRKIRLDAALRGTPCVLLTGSSGPGAEVRALDAGADAFVRKDEGIDVILARLAAVLRSTTPDRARAESLLGPKKILAIDDSATYREAVAGLLRGEGYDVVSARSGEEALEMLAAQPVDCILLDLVMPGMDGTEICRRIKSSPTMRDIPLIMLTSREEKDAMLESLGVGADDFISKNAELEVLKARVSAQLRRKQFEDEHRRVREELLHSEIAAAEERAARRIAENRAAMVEELERKNKELEAFSYSVSHDLRAPLRSIDGFSQAILEDCAEQLDDVGKSYLHRVRAAAQRMSELIDDMLELSRVGRAELHRSRADLSEIARSIVAELRRRDPGRDVEVDITPDLVANADLRLVRIVYENLIGNAWKFTSKIPHAKIMIGSAEKNGRLTYFVRDNGAGFNMAYAEKLFAPFQRLHSEAEFPGTGIGLATVQRIVDRHGGVAWAESSVGNGASIFFTLPDAS